MSIRWRCCAGGAALEREVDEVMEELSGGPFIFNLGHGILPDTPIAHVEQMLRRVRALQSCRVRPHSLRIVRTHMAITEELTLTASGMATGYMYLWLKALHIIAVISWMAGMLYLPRLFVYHADASQAPSSRKPSR